MRRSFALVLSVVGLGLAATACGAGDNDTDPRARNPSSQQNNQSLAPANNFGTTPHDMPGGSRWSGTPKSK
jgi:hypothetical protein